MGEEMGGVGLVGEAEAEGGKPVRFEGRVMRMCFGGGGGGVSDTGAGGGVGVVAVGWRVGCGAVFARGCSGSRGPLAS